MKTGIHGPYKWLEADHDIQEFLSLAGAAILGRYIAITAVDSGSFLPSGDDRAAGWTTTGGIAYSPRLESLAMLPSGSCHRDCCGFDEWYVFGNLPTPLGTICKANAFETAIAPPNVFQFINFIGFRLSDPQMSPVADLFWKQMAWVRPQSYLGDSDRCLLFATLDHSLFGIVHDTLGRSPSVNAEDSNPLS